MGTRGGHSCAPTVGDVAYIQSGGGTLWGRSHLECHLPSPWHSSLQGWGGGGRHVAEVAARWVPDRGKEMIISAQWLLFGIK